ncbi:uncharacterized protein LOC119268322 isoform X1 [Triticum dicoccoides]|uniref:uncharacterized protein LOC119268322 isoform X1 n=1 Tax=Triticum dicoccoides TaxID=85692 RepID=UPI00189029AF|nr:uncharacterized protein LOC119268322 isoform X1 [Triticum dicoccoides]
MGLDLHFPRFLADKYIMRENLYVLMLCTSKYKQSRKISSSTSLTTPDYQGMSRAARDEKRCNLSQTYRNENKAMHREKFTDRSAALCTNIVVHLGGRDLETAMGKTILLRQQEAVLDKSLLREKSSARVQWKNLVKNKVSIIWRQGREDHVIIWPVQVPMPLYLPSKPGSAS